MDTICLLSQDGRMFTRNDGFDCCNSILDNNLVNKQHKGKTFKTKSYCLDLLKHAYDNYKYDTYWS